VVKLAEIDERDQNARRHSPTIKRCNSSNLKSQRMPFRDRVVGLKDIGSFFNMLCARI
jgi:hypothetical protein